MKKLRIPPCLAKHMRCLRPAESRTSNFDGCLIDSRESIGVALSLYDLSTCKVSSLNSKLRHRDMERFLLRL